MAIGAISSSSTMHEHPLLSGILSLNHTQSTTGNRKKTRIMDVGTGGGFPGLPLAILFPHVEFLLVDSIGKKLKAIDEMAQELQVTNVKTYHGRVEEMVNHPIYGSLHKHAYDFCVGRSVAALPTFCFWIQDLLKVKDGQLLYIIGGDIDPFVESKVAKEVPINHIFGDQIISDKRILMFQAKQVDEIAAQSGEKKRIVGSPRVKPIQKTGSTTKASSRTNALSPGAWKKRDNSIKKDRGYDNFKRYES
jgi:16S rRNA (guanine527-N7)-methyltransferase